MKTQDIRLTLKIDAPSDRIYGALSSARELCAWWLDRAETDARNMGRFRFVWPDDFERKEGRGRFVDLEKGKKLAWLWESLPIGDAPPLTSFFIEAQKRGCVVTTLHGGFPARAAKLAGAYGTLWDDCMAKLALYVESGRTCKAQEISTSELELLRRKK